MCLLLAQPHKSSGKQQYFHFTAKHPEAQRGSEHLLGEKNEIEMFQFQLPGWVFQGFSTAQAVGGLPFLTYNNDNFGQ